MKKLFLLLLITICLPVHAREPSSISGSFERQPILKLSPLKGSENVLDFNTSSNNGSKRLNFVTDKEINVNNKELSDNNEKVSNFNKTVEQKPLSSRETSIQKSKNMSDVTHNTKKSATSPVNITNWTIEDAKKNIFNNVSYVKDVSAFPKIDPNFKRSKQTMKNGVQKIGNRYLTLYNNGYYSIRIMTDDLYDKTFLYSVNGVLYTVAYDIYPEEIYNAESLERAWNNNSALSYITYFYNTLNGNLESAGFKNKDTAYVINLDGSLNNYWKDNTCYYSDNNLITGKTYKY